MGETAFDDLTDAQKASATFTTSMNGTVSGIPVDYTVEVREIPAGTKYKVEERDYELPDGYTLQWYVPYAENTSSGALEKKWDERNTTPVSGLIANGLGAKVEIRNLKGWGLRVYKDWSDAEWMVSRDPSYFAVYIKDAGDHLTLVSGTVKRLAYGDTSVYWFFEHLESAVSGDFRLYEVREVTLTGDFTVDDDTGLVSGYAGEPTILNVGGIVTLPGRQIGEDSNHSYAYTIISYVEGELPAGSNVRVDTITNKRAGIDLYLKAWDGTSPLAGGTFALKDGSGNLVGTFTSDSTGLITIAYIRENKNYTLTQIASPTAYRGMQDALTISRSGDTVTVTGGTSGWFTADDADITTGTDIRIGLVNIKNKPYTLQIKKTDQTVEGEALADVVFALYRQVTGNDGQPRRDYQPISGYDDLTTDANGIIPLITAAFGNGTLAAGSYYKQTISDDLSIGFTNTRKTVSITVSKPVVGIGGDFTFTATLKAGTTLCQGYTMTTGVMTDSDGKARFTLSPENNKTVSTVLSIPHGTSLSVTEDTYPDYNTKVGNTETRTKEWTNITTDQNVTFTNTSDRKLTTTKQVTGNMGDRTRDFTFTLTRVEGWTSGKTYAWTKNGTAQTTLAPGDTFTLKHGDTVVITVPYNKAVTITEAPENYTASWQLGSGAATTGTSETVALKADSTLTVENHLDAVAPTGLSFREAPYAWLLGIAVLLGGSAVLLPRKAKRKAED